MEIACDRVWAGFFSFFFFSGYGLLVILGGGALHVIMDDRVGFGGGGLGCSGFFFFLSFSNGDGFKKRKNVTMVYHF